MFEKLEFQGKLWQVIAKVEGHRIDDPSTLKKSYGCDVVLKSNQNIFLMLNEIIDVEFEDI
tara:strand:- start:1715 stop:1897 length:183 start_codon:yes stop_codon:yes gene_type:complete